MVDDIYAYLCCLFFIIFGIWFCLFTFGGELMAHFVPGVSMLRKEKQALYDKKAIVEDTAKRFGIYAVLMLVGAVLCKFVWKYSIILVIIIWIIMVARVLKYPYSKMFVKYKMDENV